MLRHLLTLGIATWLLGAGQASANPPVASYIFPAGGQRGQNVDVRVGGLFLHNRCSFEMPGPGVRGTTELHRMPTRWFEGPILPLPESQRAEDYPRDMAGRITIDSSADLGPRSWRIWTAQGAATGAVAFMVGDLPEIVEQEIEGDPIPVDVKLPVTINGRIFPRENVDVWSFPARKGQTITCEVWAARLGSPLDSRLEVIDPSGRKIAENDDTFGADSMVRFTAAVDGKYQVRIQDVSFRGGPAYVYRLTLTADPNVDRVYPLGGQRGHKVALELTGQGLPKEPIEVQLPVAGPRDLTHQLTIGGKRTNPFLLRLDDLPEYVESEPNDEPGQVKPVPVPAMLNGRVGKPGDVDYWAIVARKGEAVSLELQAQALGSPLHAVLAVVDRLGKELARADGISSNKLDPSLQFTAPADGTYYLRITEAFAARGGPAYAYRLRVQSMAAPDFRLHLAEATAAVNRGGQVKIKVAVDRISAPGAIRLSVDGLPGGVTVPESQVTANQSNGEIVVKADAAAAIGGTRLTIRGTMKIGDQTLTRTATVPGSRGAPEVDTVLLAVTLPTPFKVVAGHEMRWAPRGTVFHRRYQIERGGFTGPLEVSLADRQARHLQGATGPVVVVPAEANEFDYPVQLPPWTETGRTCRVCVMATGVIKEPDGSEHTVSFSSVQPNEQIILVVEPGRLDVEAEQSSFLALPGKTISVPVRVSRGKSLSGPAKLELIRPAHLQAIHAEPVVMSEGQKRVEFPIRFGRDLAGPINAPIVLRATILDRGEPVIAETKIELHAAP
jgi:hypothetical protein